MSEKLREAAELFAKLSRDAGRELTYDQAGVEWASQYVEAVRPVETEDQLRVHTALVGAYLGEALLAQHGGAWVEDEGEWAVELADGTRLHPFRATMEHLREGSGSSILGLFHSAGGDGGQGTADSGRETSPPSAAEPDPTPVHEAARRFAEVIAANGGPAEYGDEMIAFVDQFVEQTRPVDPDLLDQYTTLIGAVLGESIIASFGGAWAATAEGWAVRFDERSQVLPFERARKHLQDGPDESVLTLFRSVPLVFEHALRRREEQG
ncbi:MAG TPA: hypothetical protein VFS20_08105 [Longimicrobium sp.]|nr:hypothetical protein [Longimicrobium sp.]